MTEDAGARIRHQLLDFLRQRIRKPVEPDTDLFGAHMMTSLFALELVVHLEDGFGIEVTGEDLRPANFRTVDAMTALVLRLSTSADDTAADDITAADD